MLTRKCIDNTLRLTSTRRLAGSTPALPTHPLVQALRQGMIESMRAKDKRKADTFKSVLADIQNSTHDKKVPQPDRVLKKAIGLRLDGEAKCREGATALADQYRSEIDVLAAFLTEDERTALTQASEKAKELATSETALPDLLKELRTAYSKHIDGDLLAAIGKAALASSRS